MTFHDAIEFLYHLRWFGAKPGLANTLELAALAGNPHQKLRFIHVAGTNGKGSTCAMLESIYRAAGLRVGLFTSPHLVAFGERIQVNRQPLSEDEVARLVEEMRELLERGWGAEADAPESSTEAGHPTFFEVVTVMALRYFAERKCDLVIWETGLGGRLDATNIVTPLASVITNIQFDHQQWLGDTLPQIAAEKGGIIKPGVAVITATDAPEALRVIEETALQKYAPLWIVTHGDTQRPPLDSIELPLSGGHQKLNAALAVATVRRLAAQIPLSDVQIRAGLSRVDWAGRLQLVARPGGGKILLDGAHNTGGAGILAAAIRTHRATETRITLILGVLQDKDWAAMSGILAPLAERILLTPVASERTATPRALGEACRRANPRAQVTEHLSLREAWDGASNDPFVVIAGSLYLVGEAMELVGLSSGKVRNERGLNEWKEPASTAAS